MRGASCNRESNVANTISVVIPAWNAARYVAETIASIQAQTRRPDELVVVDDGSTDDTAAVAEQALAGCPIPSRLVRQANGGVAVARNAGALATIGDLVTFVDADDVLLPDHLAMTEALLDRHPDAVAVFTDVQEFDSEGDRPSTIRNKTLSRRHGIEIAPAALDDAVLLGSGLTAVLLLGNFITNSATVLRRSALVRVGLFDPAFGIGEDRDLYMRLSLLGPFLEYQRVTARQRRHPASVMATRNTLQWAETSLRLLAAFRDRHLTLGCDEVLREAFDHAWDTWARIALREASDGGPTALRQTVRQCWDLGFRVRPGMRDWARAIRATVIPSIATPAGRHLGIDLPRGGGR